MDCAKRLLTSTSLVVASKRGEVCVGGGGTSQFPPLLRQTTTTTVLIATNVDDHLSLRRPRRQLQIALWNDDRMEMVRRLVL